MYRPFPAQTAWFSLAAVFCLGAGPELEPDLAARQRAASRVCLQEVPQQLRERTRKVLENPTLYSRGPAEAFVGSNSFYEWLLDHPDRGVEAWRRLGARCTQVKQVKDGLYTCTDGRGSEIEFQPIIRGPATRAWYAHGKVRSGPLMPGLPVEMVLVLRFGHRPENNERSVIFHQAHLFLLTDSKAVTVVSKLLGGSVHKLAEQTLGQMENFYSGLVWYLDRHPDKTDFLLSQRTASKGTGR